MEVVLRPSCLDGPRPRLLYARTHVENRHIHPPAQQLVCACPHGCTGTRWRWRRGRGLVGIQQEEKWISSLLPAKIKLVIKAHLDANERVGKRATSTNPVVLITLRKDNRSQTKPPPPTPPQREHAGRGNQNLLTLLLKPVSRFFSRSRSELEGRTRSGELMLTRAC